MTSDLDIERLRRARRAIAKLRRTIVPDLRTMQEWAKGFDAAARKSPELGALNFALMMVALVGCEALGFWTMGASAHRKARQPHTADVGCYIIDVIDRFFPPASRFRKVSKILADYVRHDLVHGFGVRRTKLRFDAAIKVRPDSHPPVRFQGRHLLVLDAVAFADDFIMALDSVARRLKGDMELAARCSAAAAYRFPKMGKSIRNQFIAAHDYFARHAED